MERDGVACLERFSPKFLCAKFHCNDDTDLVIQGLKMFDPNIRVAADRLPAGAQSHSHVLPAARIHQPLSAVALGDGTVAIIGFLDDIERVEAEVNGAWTPADVEIADGKGRRR